VRIIKSVKKIRSARPESVSNETMTTTVLVVGVIATTTTKISIRVLRKFAKIKPMTTATARRMNSLVSASLVHIVLVGRQMKAIAKRVNRFASEMVNGLQSVSVKIHHKKKIVMAKMTIVMDKSMKI